MRLQAPENVAMFTAKALNCGVLRKMTVR